MTLKKIAIIGAGPAGCACAIRLSQITNYKITLISAPEKDFYIGECVPPDIKKPLLTLNLYKAFLKDKHIPSFGSCSYWGSQYPGYNDSIMNPHGHGWHLNRKKFNQLLTQTADSKKNIQLIENSTFRKTLDTNTLIYKDADGANRTLSYDFIIDASGPKSIVAKSFGETQIHDTPLICVGMKFKQEKPALLSHLTQIEAVKHGWWYATSLPNQEALVTLFTHASIIKKLQLNSFLPWHNLLEGTSTEHWLKEYHYSPSQHHLFMFAAHSFCLSSIHGRNWLAVGDAASCYDPITSNGIIKSITEGIRSAEMLRNGDRYVKNLYIHDQNVKARYEHYRNMRSLYYNLERRWPNSAFWKLIQNPEEGNSIQDFAMSHQH